VRDEAFLLRCASTFNWNLLFDRCLLIKEIFSSPSSDPMHLIRVAAASHQLQVMDEWQNTALHLACFHSAPIEVIVSILEAAGAADPPIQITSFLTGDNSTPLLIACATRASPDTIQALLNPPGDQLIRGGLHAGFPDDQGATTLSELWNIYEKRKTNNAQSPKALLANEQQLWTNIEAILEAAWSATHVYEAASKIHSAANLAESFPPPLADAILERYPDASSRSDEHSMLPLHIAISTPSTRPHRNLKEQRAYMITKLLGLYPKAAKRALPGKRPRSPFCAAIASGLDWHVVSSSLPQSEGPLFKIWQCAPEALPSRDMETGLYPFLLAATVETRHDDAINDSAKLDNIYNVLRLYPQAIQDMMSTTS